MSTRNLLFVDTPDYGLGPIGNEIEHGFRKRQDREVKPADPDFAAIGRNMVARNRLLLGAMQGKPGNRAERRARARLARVCPHLYKPGFRDCQLGCGTRRSTE